MRRIPVGADLRADVKAMARAVTRNTIMLVVSAAGYPHGLLDPVEAAARVARRAGVCLHVDCCLGGFVLPFARQLGYDIPPFHFEVDGVTSISVDTHKFAMAQKGSSVVLYRDHALRAYQFTCVTEWTGGLYASPSQPGSRSGSLIAQTWAALVSVGMDGYLAATKELMAASHKLQAGVTAIPGLRLLGKPDMCVVAWTATSVNVLELNDVMTAKGWTLNVLQFPNAVHMCLTMGNVDCVARLLVDLKQVRLPPSLLRRTAHTGVA
jgi:sphinganine-1-phosphate aldolase